MARITGYRCDRPGCTTVVQDAEKAPDGWIRVQPIINGSTDSFDMCSNKCLGLFAKARVQADKETTPTTDGKQAQADALRIGSLQRWHREGKHKNDPKPECPDCIEETAP